MATEQRSEPRQGFHLATIDGWVTVDDDDRDECPETPWTVSCGKCQMGVLFTRTFGEALDGALAHESEHKAGKWGDS